MRKFSFYSIPTCLFVWIAEAPRNKLWQYISLSIWNKYLRKEGKLHQISTVSFLFNGQLLSMGKFHLPLCAKRYVVYECSLACNFSRPWNAGLSLDSYIHKPQTEPRLLLQIRLPHPWRHIIIIGQGKGSKRLPNPNFRISSYHILHELYTFLLVKLYLYCPTRDFL